MGMYDENGFTDVVNTHIIGPNNNPAISILYGVVLFAEGFIPLIFRFADPYFLARWGAYLPFFNLSVFPMSYDIMWVLHLIIFGVPFLLWPFTYIPNTVDFTNYWLHWVDKGANWAGAIFGVAFLILWIVSIILTPTTAELTTLIYYPIVMGVSLWFTWWFLRGLL